MPKEHEIIKEIDLFKDHLVLYIKKDGTSSITVVNVHKSTESYKIELPEKIAEI